MKLTDAQLGAIQRTGQDVCVVAGPGSGKTTVLIERFKWLVEEQGVDPARILAITFTEKAATEIKRRLIERFADRFKESPDLRDGIERAWVSTIHGFCARLLRENAIAAGLAPDFAVLEQAAADRLARDSAEDALEEMFRERPAEMRRVFEALDLSTDDLGRKPDLAQSLLVVYESMRVEGLRELPQAAEGADAWPRARELAEIAIADRSAIGAHSGLLREFAARLLNLPGEIGGDHFAALDAVDTFHLNRIGKGTRALEAARELKDEIVPILKQQWIGRWYAGEAHLLREAVARLDAIYRAKKRRDAVLDFADLEAEAIRLLEENGEIRERTASRFDQILMDELQDTNRLQWRLVNLIRRGFFGVGDLNQSIYGFRHAEAEVFAEYRARLIAAGASIDDLRENHRSVPEVLEAVSSVLDGQPGIETRKLIASRESVPNPDDESSVELLVARGGGEDEDAEEIEASLIAARICELQKENVPLHDIAILVRTLSAAKAIERALDEFAIRFLVSGGRTFLEAREIRDLLALLAGLVNPLDEIAVAGVLRSPLAGMSDEEIFRIGPEGRRAEFDRRFGKLREKAGFTAPDLLLSTALDECGYVVGLPERARANIEKLLAHIRREHAKHPRPLAELLDDLEALRATQSEAEAPPPEAGDVVRVMTIHAAKGLEFPVVFVGALHRQTDATKPVIVFSPEEGVGAKWRNPATGEGQSDHAHVIILEETKRKEAEEENRLLYVAMTRAENRLILSYTEKKRRSGWPKLIMSKIAVTRTAEKAIDSTDAGPGAVSIAGLPDRLLDRPANVTRRDGAAAVTAVAAFRACPRKYLLSSISRGTRPPAGFEEGDLSAEGDLAEQSDLVVEESGVAFGAEVHRVLAGDDVGSAAAQQLAAGFLDSDLGRRAARADRIEREFDFLFYFQDVVLRGQIDLWFEEAGELIIVDYKTDINYKPGREESSWGAPGAPGSDAYELQLQIYALALERYAGRRADRAVLYYLRSGTEVEIRIDEGEARAAVRKFLDAQDSLEFPMNPGIQCRRCAFFGNQCVGTGAAAAG